MDKQLNELLQKNTKILEMLASKEAGMHTKQPASFSTYTPLHGPGGIFTGDGIEREVVTAHVRPMGIASELPLIDTVFTNPQFATLTGITDAVGDQPANSCDDAPTSYVKGCNITAQLGSLRFDSQTIDMDDVMLRLHRGDFTDLVLRGRLLGLTNLGPSSIEDSSDVLNVVTASEMVQMGVQFERALTTQIWQGSVANTNEFPGLDDQIATGIVDTVTNQACPAMDSDVKDFAYDLVGGSGRDIVNYLSSLEFYLRHNATRMGLDPVEWVIVMRPELWFELSAVWPCAYNTSRCSDAMLGDNSRTFIDGRDNTAERDSMRNNMRIPINGTMYRVVTDDGIFEHTNVNNANLNAGQYASSIYMVPLTISGGMPVTYREYLDYRRAQTDVAFTNNRLDAWWTDNGVYAWSLSQEKWCYVIHAKTQQRVILRTPHLAGRIDSVAYEPLQHLRSPFPDDPYHYDGGVSLRGTDPNYNSVWAS